MFMVQPWQQSHAYAQQTEHKDTVKAVLDSCFGSYEHFKLTIGPFSIQTPYTQYDEKDGDYNIEQDVCWIENAG